MSAVELIHVEDEGAFGGKAVQLGAALRVGLPVPPGVAFAWQAVDAIAKGQHAMLEGVLDRVRPPVAVRSSGVGEDAANASFAGQHATVLDVRSPQQLVGAFRRVWSSAHTDSALAYRKRMGLPGEPKMGVVVQRLVPADCAGVLFTRNPLDGADERVIEAAWGLGEVVVAGLVTPDRYRIARSGVILERTAGEKDIAIRPQATEGAEGGAREVQVDADLVHALCLDDTRLRRLHELASLCEAHAQGHLDLEWAFCGDELFLLQRRAITKVAAR